MPRGLILSTFVFAAAASPAAAALHRVDEMVVFPNGSARTAHVYPKTAPVTVRGKRCTVPAATPLAALVRGGIGPLSLHDYGACSKRAADAGGLFVRAIAGVENKGSDGWVYKVGNRLGTAGAADPAGPFGRGRLTNGDKITWFWCHVTPANKGCQHNLDFVFIGGSVDTMSVRVREHDDHGSTIAVSGATVHAGSRTAISDSTGVAGFSVKKGDHYAVWAEAPGRIRSFRRYWAEP